MTEPTIKEVKDTSTDIEITGSFEGIPYKGQPINMKSTDDPTSVLKLNQVVYVKRFALKNEEDLKEYQKVCQKIQDGHAQLSYENQEYDVKDQNWIILMRWIDWWYTAAGEKK
jgi:hypothetical protein